MYCPSCGAEQTQGLKYCNRCGANLAQANEASSSRVTSMVWAVATAVVVVSIGGFIMAFIFGMEFMSRKENTTATVIFLIFFLLVILGIAALLVRQLSRLISAYLEKGGKRTEPAALPEPHAARLAAPQEPVPGVAEQTTRRFEPVPKK
ncbi:MAG: hypothetical protein JO360_07910 [Acidobacteria bacterium]|nr:hypothetical protein [Acidobacteriota bacterium]